MNITEIIECIKNDEYLILNGDIAKNVLDLFFVRCNRLDISAEGIFEFLHSNCPSKDKNSSYHDMIHFCGAFYILVKILYPLMEQLNEAIDRSLVQEVPNEG